MHKKLLVAYILSLLTLIIFFFTDYSFSIEILNIFLIVFIISYPVVLFFRSQLSITLKIISSVVVLIILLILGSNLLPFLEMSSEEVKQIERWRSNGYIVTLTKRLGWAGPQYYRYDLSKTKLLGLVHKTVDYAYPGTELDSSCIVEFEQQVLRKKSIIILNKCESQITRIK